MMHKREIKRGYEVPKLMIGLRVSDNVFEKPAVFELLPKLLELVQKRFKASVILVMPGFSFLKPEILTDWLKRGLIQESICSGHEEFLLLDLIEASVRSSAEMIMLADVGDVIANLAGALRFWIDCSSRSVGFGNLSPCGSHFCTTAEALRAMPRRKLAGTWHKQLHALHLRCAKQGEAEPSPNSALTLVVSDLIETNKVQNRHFFITREGAERFGGTDKMRLSPLVVAGAKLDSFTWWWILDSQNTDTSPTQINCSSAGTKETYVSSVVSMDDDNGSVIFDIWPAPHEFGNQVAGESEGSVRVPRQIVVGRRCPVSPGKDLENQQRKAVFITSNFNKSRYIQASLYSLMIQAHPRICVEIVDDLSNDDSIEKISAFKRLIDRADELVHVRSNHTSRGTYWIRNDVIAKNEKDDVVFFINDSDDCSSAMRVALQLESLRDKSDRYGCFLNIVRVDSGYASLPLNKEVERYGTASLCFTPSLIRRVGYFQTIKKNADTEFIERVKRFIGVEALPWIRHPVLFQPFDGGNLTSDIYAFAVEGAAISASLGTRALHTEIFRRDHERLKEEQLTSHFNFPFSTLPREYSKLGSEFLVDGYRETDGCIVIMDGLPSANEINGLAKNGYCILSRGAGQSWLFHSRKHEVFITDLSLAETLSEYAQRFERHAYVVAWSLLSDQLKGKQSIAKALSSIRDPWIYRSKSEGDKWAYTANGNRIDIPEAISRMEKHFMDRQQETWPVLMHTSHFVRNQ